MIKEEYREKGNLTESWHEAIQKNISIEDYEREQNESFLSSINEGEEE